MQAEIARFRVRAVKRTGDGYLATFDGPARAIQCACAAGREMRRLGIEIRYDPHTGEVELADGDVTGIAVHTAARAGRGRANEVWASRTVKDLAAGSRFRFADRGTYTLKGVAGDWPLFAVEF
jgi:class 3 adenylate cyclase